MQPRKLDRFFSPRSIAIIGASEDFSKINGRPLKHLLEKGYPGKIFPINPKYDTLAGLPCYANLREVPGVVDLAIVAVPAAAVADAIRACGDKKVGGAVVYSSGFGEMGEDGRVREQALARLAGEVNVPLCGPNTLGFWNAFERVVVSFSQAADGEVAAGPVAFVTQSGAFGTAIVELARQRGIPFGYFVNSGNEADLSFAELLRYVINDPNVRVIAGYIEGLKDGGDLLEVAEEARALGKPIVLVKVGRFTAGARAALSHTGSLAGSDRVYTGVFRQKAIVRAYDVDELIDAVAAFSLSPRPRGRRIGIVTQSGGAGVLMADRAEELGLDVVQLTDDTAAALRRALPAFGSFSNPIDITAQFIAQPSLLRDAISLVIRDPNVDLVVFYLGMMGRFADAIVENLRAAAGGCAKPLLVAWAAAPPDAQARMQAAGMCMLPGAARAITAAKALVEYAQALGRSNVPLRRHPAISRIEVPTGVLSARASFGIVEAAGVAVAPWRFVRSADAASRAALDLGFPVALKVESAEILHKSDVGGVRLGLNSERAVREAFEQVVGTGGRYPPGAIIDGAIVQKMVECDVEAIVGIKRDPQFGPLIMVGLGGIFVEIFEDVAFRVAPLTRADALDMLRELRSYPLLEGARGRPCADIDALVELIMTVARLAVDAGDTIAELDLNPIKVRPVGLGAVAVDALIAGRAGTSVVNRSPHREP